MKKLKYFVERPPLHKKFELPTRKELLKIKIDDCVKLIFSFKSRLAADGYGCERMWVEVKYNEDCDFWVGELANIPFTTNKIKIGDDIFFHPLDIIDIKYQK
jgi:uncharacterized protein YegJ (DUF2314 family)